jgi:hypothetical protein
MEASNKLLQLLRALLLQLPSLLTLLVCIVFAVVRWKRHPKVSSTLLISLTLLFIHGIAFSVVYTWVPSWFITPANYDPLVTRNVYLVLGLIANTTAAAAFAMLLAAIFMQRKPAPINSENRLV